MNIQAWLTESFPALTHQTYRRYWLAMTCSTLGTWMQNTMLPWITYSLTKSAFLLGLVGALQFAPMLLFSLFAGVILDRIPKRTIIMWTQGLSLAITAVLAVLVLGKHITYGEILFLSALLGLVNTFDMPARQAFQVEMVGRQDLMNAIALNMSTFNLSRILGPMVASIVMAADLAGLGFLYNALSFGAVILVLALAREPKALDDAAALPGSATPDQLLPPPETIQPIRGAMMDEILQGIRYIRKNRLLVGAVVSAAIVGTFAYNFSVLLPVFSVKILGGSAQSFAWLMSIMGMGSLAGAILMAVRAKYGLKSHFIALSGMVMGLLLAGIGLSRSFAVTAAFLAATGLFSVISGNLTQSTLQLTVDDEYRGRVTSMHTLVNAGTTPIGNLFVGIITDTYSAATAFLACGGIIIGLFALCLALGLYSRGKTANPA